MKLKADFSPFTRKAILAAGLIISAISANAQVGGGYDLVWNTIDGGGGTFSTGGSYSLGGTIGQPDASITPMTGGSYTLTGGFWVAATTPAATINVTGKVKLQGWTGATLPQVVVTIDGVPQTLTLTPVSTGNGTFTVAVASSGSHTVRVKPKGFLSEKLTITTSGSPMTLYYDSNHDQSVGRTTGPGMISGDVTNDDIIDDSDLLAVINNFLNPPPAGVYDTNGDNLLDDTDLLAVINHFLSVGDA